LLVDRLATTLNDQRKSVAMDAIAHAAVGEFAKRGFAATTVEDIAAAAGCSARTFYRYFSTKEDVMFHDLPVMLDRLRTALDAHLEAGLGCWAAVTETLVGFISRFDTPADATDRMRLWVSEPGLRTTYIQYVTQAEGVIADSVESRCPEAMSPDVPLLMGVVAVGAYRVTLFANDLSTREPLGERLRSALSAAATELGSG